MTIRLGVGVGAHYQGHPFVLQALTHQLRHFPSPTFSFQPWSLLPTHPPSSAPWKQLPVEGFGGGEQETYSFSAPCP